MLRILVHVPSRPLGASVDVVHHVPASTRHPREELRSGREGDPRPAHPPARAEASALSEGPAHVQDTPGVPSVERREGLHPRGVRDQTRRLDRRAAQRRREVPRDHRRPVFSMIANKNLLHNNHQHDERDRDAYDDLRLVGHPFVLLVVRGRCVFLLIEFFLVGLFFLLGLFFSLTNHVRTM